MLVAADTRVGCPSSAVFLTEIVDYFTGKDVPEVHHVMRYVQLVGDPLGVLHGVYAAAAAEPVARRPDLHGDADHPVTGLFQPGGGH